MSYINQIVEDRVAYDIAAKNLVDGFTQDTPGVNALDAAAGKRLNTSLANLSDSLANYLPLSNLPLSIKNGGTGANNPIDAAKAIGIQMTNVGMGQTKEFSISGNVALIFGRRGANYFVALVTYWDDTVTYISQNGKKPTITKNGNSNDVTYTNDAGIGAYPTLFITGQTQD